jgi:hypothetical protein
MEPGTPIRCQMSKWGDRPHWGFDAIYLGVDEHGEWIGAPGGTHHTRPGHEFHSDVDAVTLVPSGGWYAATFYAPGIWCEVYVDLATPATWDGPVLRSVDLDLDVIRLADPLPDAAQQAGVDAGRVAGGVFVDDEDEFAEHQVTFGYPTEVVGAARGTCDELVGAVRAGLPPYDGTHLHWLTQLSRVTSLA